MSILINYYRKKHNNNNNNKHNNNESHCEEAEKKRRRTQRSVAGRIVCVLFDIIPDEREIIIPQTISLQQPHLHPETSSPSPSPVIIIININRRVINDFHRINIEADTDTANCRHMLCCNCCCSRCHAPSDMPLLYTHTHIQSVRGNWTDKLHVELLINIQNVKLIIESNMKYSDI